MMGGFIVFLGGVLFLLAGIFREKPCAGFARADLKWRCGCCTFPPGGEEDNKRGEK